MKAKDLMRKFLIEDRRVVASGVCATVELVRIDAGYWGKGLGTAHGEIGLRWEVRRLRIDAYRLVMGVLGACSRCEDSLIVLSPEPLAWPLTNNAFMVLAGADKKVNADNQRTKCS